MLEHQRALRAHCEALESQAGRQSAGSGRRVRLPALCVFLENWDPLTRNGLAGDGGERLEMVNWLPLHAPGADIGAANSSSGAGATATRTPRLARDSRLAAAPGGFSASPPPIDHENTNINIIDQRQQSKVLPNMAARAGDSRDDVMNENEIPEIDHDSGGGGQPSDVDEASDRLLKQAIKSYRGRFEAELSTVILIPGLLGSRLQVKLDKPSRVNVFCRTQTNTWQEMWLSIKNFLPFLVDCWFDNAKLIPNPAREDKGNEFTNSPPGVQVRVPDFGSVRSVRQMDLNSVRVSRYYAQIIEHYESLGYTPDKNLLAAPYDFRLAPQQLAAYFDQLTGLIEGACRRTGTQDRGQWTPATLVCHSMGCTHMLVYLRAKGAEWRRLHVRKLIALSSPWGGAFKALKALVVGDQLDLPLVGESKMRSLARTFPSIAYLLPQSEVFGLANKRNPDQATLLVRTPSRSYDPSQVSELLSQGLNLTIQARWYELTTSLIRPLEPLADLRLDCVHSLNVPTMETLLFRQDAHFPDGPYELLFGQGDGTVNEQSLRVCELWASQLPQLVRHKIIWNTNHVGVLSHPATLQMLTNDVLLGDT